MDAQATEAEFRNDVQIRLQCRNSFIRYFPVCSAVRRLIAQRRQMLISLIIALLPAHGANSGIWMTFTMVGIRKMIKCLAVIEVAIVSAWQGRIDSVLLLPPLGKQP